MKKFLKKAANKAQTAANKAQSAVKQRVHNHAQDKLAKSILWVEATPNLYVTSLTQPQDEQALNGYLKQYHEDKYMIFNLSARVPKTHKKVLDYENFDHQVLEFSLPNHPRPLTLLFELCASLHKWLQAEPTNIAVIHSLSMSRAVMVLQCYLTYSGQFDSGLEVVQLLAKRFPDANALVCAPSHMRYGQYFTDLLQLKALPNKDPLFLHLVVMPSVVDTTSGDNALLTPHFQVLKGKKLMFTSSWDHVESSTDEETSVRADALVTGDVVIKCYNKRSSTDRVQVFRFSFHVGFMTPGIIRVTRKQLDIGPIPLPANFYLDLVFTPTTDQTLDPKVQAALEKEHTSSTEHLTALIHNAPAVVTSSVAEVFDSEEAVAFDADVFAQHHMLQMAARQPPAPAVQSPSSDIASPSQQAAAIPAPAQGSGASGDVDDDEDDLNPNLNILADAFPMPPASPASPMAGEKPVSPSDDVTASPKEDAVVKTDAETEPEAKESDAATTAAEPEPEPAATPTQEPISVADELDALLSGATGDEPTAKKEPSVVDLLDLDPSGPTTSEGASATDNTAANGDAQATGAGNPQQSLADELDALLGMDIGSGLSGGDASLTSQAPAGVNSQKSMTSNDSFVIDDGDDEDVDTT